MSSKEEIKRRVFISLTLDEENYYSKIFEILNFEKTGKISANSLAHFIRDSGLTDKILKEIFLLTSHKNIYYIEKDEFFIILRLIALAQNKIAFTKDSLEKNKPIPPLPKFYFLNKNNLLNKKDIFEITEDIEKKYLKLFYKKKDTRKDFISKLKTIFIWNEKNSKDINVNENIIKSLEPSEKKDFLNIKEFVVGCYLLHLSKIIKMPINLPNSILNYLGRKSDIKDIKNNNSIKIIELGKMMKVKALNIKDNQIQNQNENRISSLDKSKIKNENLMNIQKSQGQNIYTQQQINKFKISLINSNMITYKRENSYQNYKNNINHNHANKIKNYNNCLSDKIKGKPINNKQLGEFNKENQGTKSKKNIRNIDINIDYQTNFENDSLLDSGIEIEKTMKKLEELSEKEIKTNSLSNSNAESAYINDNFIRISNEKGNYYGQMYK